RANAWYDPKILSREERALIRIGAPAVPALVDHVHENLGEPHWDNGTCTLAAIGRDAVVPLLPCVESHRDSRCLQAAIAVITQVSAHRLGSKASRVISVLKARAEQETGIMKRLIRMAIYRVEPQPLTLPGLSSADSAFDGFTGGDE
ncbi:MAG: hypothetical protein AAF517_20105, partial [Planctomycetota bacterium]